MMDAKPLTQKQHAILEYLRQRQGEYVSPTKVGNDVKGKALGHTAGSAWCNPALKVLAARGLVERSPRGQWRAVPVK